MVYKKQKNRSGMMFVKTGLVKALSSLREKSARSQGDDKKRFHISGKEMVILGQLVYSWKEIAGVQLASKTRPFRFIKGKLLLTVSDSQWLQTLTFLKPKILQKIMDYFPNIGIKEVQGKLGKIPTLKRNYEDDLKWPDWKKEAEIELPEIKNPELSKTIQECRKKLNARMRGLEGKGYILCKSCSGNYTKNADGICAVCIFKERSMILSRTRSLMAEFPWISYEECHSEESTLKVVEYEAIKSQLLMDSLQIISNVGEQLIIQFNNDFFLEMKKEMVRAIMFHTGQTPDEIDFFELSQDQIPDRRWVEFLAVEGDK